MAIFIKIILAQIILVQIILFHIAYRKSNIKFYLCCKSFLTQFYHPTNQRYYQTFAMFPEVWEVMAFLATATLFLSSSISCWVSRVLGLGSNCIAKHFANMSKVRTVVSMLSGFSVNIATRESKFHRP